MSGAHETDDAALVRMVNQIAKNFGHHNADVAAAEVAKHLGQFWAPAMRLQLERYIDAGGSGVDPVPLQAVGLLV